MQRTSPVSVLGAVVLVSVMGNQACLGPVDVQQQDPEGIGVVGDPPALQALLGEGFTVVWSDHNLARGERIQRVEADGSLTLLGEHGHVWIDLEPGAAYRWEGAGDELVVEPGVLELSVDADGQPTVDHRGDAVTRGLSWEGADLYGLSVALVVERDGEVWLDQGCADGLPCWRDEPQWWARWDQGDLPAELSVEWFAALEEPATADLEFRLELVQHEVGLTLASASTRVVESGRQLLWGDLHSHSNLSGDACEDQDNSCLPWGESPGSEMFRVAEENGLDFLALTDHAEHETYHRLDQDLDLDSHDETVRLALEAEGGPVIPIVGFEWTGMYDVRDPASGDIILGGGHRTIIFDGLEPCAEFWVAARQFGTTKAEMGFEDYTQRDFILGTPDALAEHLAETALECDPIRYLSWFHHSGNNLPQAVNWDLDLTHGLGDLVVEMYSEHGSSECQDLTASGCDWSVDHDYHEPIGAVQTALQQGYALGFVGGTDSHDGRPGSIEDGASVVVFGGSDGMTLHEQRAPGGVTAALVAGATPGRTEIVDAVELRQTMAASWLFDRVNIVAIGQDGQVYLPGDDVPQEASPLDLVVEIDDVAVESWLIEVVDPFNEIHLDIEHNRLREPLDLNPGEARYVRVRAYMQDQEHRLWASPFFGVK